MAKFDSTKLKRIGVFTSGGDAPGMNAAIRAVVRSAIVRGLEVVGFRQGYFGLLNNSLEELQLRSVANTIQRGGTFLKTGRCPEFMHAENRAKAAANIRQNKVDALVCIGGDGSFAGAQALWNEQQIPVVGVPGTIDNDLWGTDRTIGFDTAINTALNAVDRIRDTAASHDRLFIVEVMGHNSGFIAVATGLACGAEDVFIPESPFDLNKVIQKINQGAQRGKSSSILIAAEGQKPGRSYDLAEAIRKKSGHEAKVCVLGHVQRGGPPTAVDRILASSLGAAAVTALLDGECNIMIGHQGFQVARVDLDQCLSQKPEVEKHWIELAQILSN